MKEDQRLDERNKGLSNLVAFAVTSWLLGLALVFLGNFFYGNTMALLGRMLCILAIISFVIAILMSLLDSKNSA